MNTRNKRASSVMVGLPWRGLMPVADNTVDASDRQFMALMYMGIAAGGFVPPAPSPGRHYTPRDRRLRRVRAWEIN